MEKPFYHSLRNVYILATALAVVLSGCKTVKKATERVYLEIKQNALDITHENIYWLTHEDIFLKISLDDLLKTELTEEKVVEIALLNNPHLQSQYERIGLATAAYKQAGLLQNPFFMFNYQFSTSNSQPEQINFNLIQNFLEILLIPKKKKVAAKNIAIIKNELLGEVIEIISQAKIVFHNLQIENEVLEVQKKILLSKQLAYDAGLILKNAQDITDLDLTIKHAEYESVKLDVETAEIALLDTRQVLNNLLGLWGKQVTWKFSKKREPFIGEIETSDDIENDAIKCNLTLKNDFEKMQARAIELNIDTAHLVFPHFNLGLSSQYQTNIFFPGPQIGANLPIFDTGSVHAQSNKSELANIWHSLLSDSVRIRSIARKNHYNYINAFKQTYLVKTTLLPLAQRAFRETFLQHNAMQLGVFALLSSKENELMQQISFLQKEKEFFKQKIFIEALSQGHIISGNNL